MPRILRRPMFRGGPVRSEGTGITSGLDQGYAQGGRVGLRDGEGIFDSVTNFFSPEIVSDEDAAIRRNEGTLFAPVTRDPMELLYATPVGRLGGIGQGALKTYGKYPQVLDEFKRYITKKEVPDFIAGPKGVSPYQAPGFGTNAAIKEAISPYLSGAKELAMSGLGKVKDYGLAIAGAGGLGYGAYKGLSGNQGGIGGGNNGSTTQIETEAERQKKLYEKQIEDMKIAHANELSKLTGMGTSDSGESDISKWSKEARDALGYEESKKQSIYDAMLAASPAFFRGRTLTEAAPNIFESINKSGAFDKPTNIKQAAAQLAIQRKMMQEKAIAEEKTRYGVLEAREGFKSKNPIERLVAYKFDPSQVFEGPVPADQRLWKVGKVYIDSAGKLGIGKKDEITKLVKIVSLE